MKTKSCVATSDEYRNENHSEFPDALVPATGAARDDADVHPVSVQVRSVTVEVSVRFC